MIETWTDDGTTLFFGPGAETRTAGALVDAGAERVLCIAPDNHRDGADRIARALGDRHAGTFTTTEPQVPGAVADAATEQAREAGADWLLAHGGGTPIGVAKAVALELEVAIAAVPTTYAGSERTDIWGIRRGAHKTTGRDPRVRPRLVIYDPALTLELPLELSAESLLNAAAHAFEAVYAVRATDAAREAGLESLPRIVRALRGLLDAPRDVAARTEAMRGSLRAAEALQGASMALQHKLAHVLAGTLGTPHAATHALLAPYTLHFNAGHAPQALDRIHAALDSDDAPALLYDLAREAGLATGLADLDVDRDRLDEVADLAADAPYPNPRPLDRPALRRLLEDLWHDRRPSLHTRRIPLDADGRHARHPASARGPADADVAVLALHGRGGSADRLLADLEAIAPDPGTAWLAPMADDRSWYPKGFAAQEANEPWRGEALAAVDAAWAHLTARRDPDRVLVTGFSQGACLALTWLSTRPVRPGRVVILSGALDDPDRDLAHLAGVPVHLGVSEADPWIPADRFAVTARVLEDAGAVVSVQRVPGDDHAIHDPDAAALRAALEALHG